MPYNHASAPEPVESRHIPTPRQPAALGVTKQAVHKRFAPTVAPALDQFTRRAKSALSAATHDARSLGHNYVGTEHLLLALFADSTSLAAKILNTLGADHDRVQSDVIAILTGQPNSDDH